MSLVLKVGDDACVEMRGQGFRCVDEVTDRPPIQHMWKFSRGRWSRGLLYFFYSYVPRGLEVNTPVARASVC